MPTPVVVPEDRGADGDADAERDHAGSNDFPVLYEGAGTRSRGRPKPARRRRPSGCTTGHRRRRAVPIRSRSPARGRHDRRPGVDHGRVGSRRITGRRGLRDLRDPHLAARAEMAGRLRALAHHLDRVHHVGRVVVVGLAERRGPGRVRCHLRQHRGERGQCLDGRIPWLRIGGGGEWLSLQRRILHDPVIGGRDLVGYVAPASTSATSLSGNSAIGATIW